MSDVDCGGEAGEDVNRRFSSSRLPPWVLGCDPGESLGFLHGIYLKALLKDGPDPDEAPGPELSVLRSIPVQEALFLSFEFRYLLVYFFQPILGHDFSLSFGPLVSRRSFLFWKPVDRQSPS